MPRALSCYFPTGARTTTSAVFYSPHGLLGSLHYNPLATVLRPPGWPLPFMRLTTHCKVENALKWSYGYFIASLDPSQLVPGDFRPCLKLSKRLRQGYPNCWMPHVPPVHAPHMSRLINSAGPMRDICGTSPGHMRDILAFTCTGTNMFYLGRFCLMREKWTGEAFERIL